MTMPPVILRPLAWTLALLLTLPPAAAVAQEPVPSPSPTPSPSPLPSPSPVVPEARPPRGFSDKRRTLRSYDENLGYNLVGVVTRGNIKPLLAGAALTLPAYLLDDEAIDFWARHPAEDFGKIGKTVGGGLLVAGLTVGLFSAGRIARGDRFRAATYDVSQAILVNGAWTLALKVTVRRERPDASNRLSFPSGHSSSAFAGATVIARHYGWKLGVPVYTVAGLISVSRMAANAHHFSDVVAGAAFGCGVGRVVVRRNSRPPTPPGGETPPQPEKPAELTLWLDAGPSRDGAGLALSIRF